MLTATKGGKINISEEKDTISLAERFSKLIKKGDFILGKEVAHEPKKFELEWTHALTEYHEFLILNYSTNNIFCLLLAYD